MKITILPLALLLAGVPAVGQTLKSVQAVPAAAKPGEKVTVTVQFELNDNPNCGLRVHFGDGATTSTKVNQAKDATMTFTHAYAKPGNYVVMAEPKRDGIALKCLGENQRTQVTVAAPAATATAAAAPAARSGPACPPGWKLAAKSVNRKTGAFQCTAKAGTAAPAERVHCPGDLTYYENLKKGQLGCRP